MSETKKATANDKLGRYNVVLLAQEWMGAVKDQDEYREMGQSELVKVAVEGIKAGEITQEIVNKIIAAKKKEAAADTADEKKSEKSDKGEK